MTNYMNMRTHPFTAYTILLVIGLVIGGLIGNILILIGMFGLIGAVWRKMFPKRKPDITPLQTTTSNPNPSDEK